MPTPSSRPNVQVCEPGLVPLLVPVLTLLALCAACRSTPTDDTGPVEPPVAQTAAPDEGADPVRPTRGTRGRRTSAPVAVGDGRTLRNDLTLWMAQQQLSASAQDLERWRDDRASSIDALAESERAEFEQLYQSVRLQLLGVGVTRGEVDAQTLVNARFVGLSALTELVRLHRSDARAPVEEALYQELSRRRAEDMERAVSEVRSRLMNLSDEARVDAYVDELLSMPGDSEIASAAAIRAIAEESKLRIAALRASRAENERLAALAEAQRRAARPAESNEPELPPLPQLPVVRGPFDGLAGGNVLNAIHAGDRAAVATFNEYYRGRKIRQLRSLVGDHPFRGLFEAGIRAIRLEENVMAVYLFRYDSNFADCLGDDAVEFEVTETIPDVVLENLLGTEVARYPGGTIRRRYRVKPEFASAFWTIGEMAPEGGMSELGDLLMNAGGSDLRRDATQGTRQLLTRFDCDSEVVAQFERALLALLER